jgi:cation transport regulator
MIFDNPKENVEKNAPGITPAGFEALRRRRQAARAGVEVRGQRRSAMPYAVNADLPPSVRSHLPEQAQDIFREAFNHAHAAHAHDPRQEEAAFRIAWAAVKREYMKVGEQWERRR